MDLLDLQNKIHRQNIEKGWWDNHRSFSKLTNLNISEISEAVEADRKNLMDDKLEDYKGVPVEAADGCIRGFDVLGSMDNKGFTASKEAVAIIESKAKDVDYLLALSSWYFSMSWQAFEFKKSPDLAKQYIIDAIKALFQVISLYGHDPVELILEKIEFNATRTDHKKENRQGLAGQKSY